MDWFKSLFKKSAPKEDSIPDYGLDIRIAFSNDQGSWSESVNLLECLQEVLTELGRNFTRHEDHLIVEPGLKVVPRLTWFKPGYPKGIQTATIITTEYPAKIPNGIFEYQHASATNLKDAICQGFKSWATHDLPVFIDYVNASLTECTAMELKAPATYGRGETIRRALLGPPTQTYFLNPPEDQEHCFCPCCLLTNSVDMLKELMNGDEFNAVRLLAIRNADGTTQADCRVNGAEYEAGKAALAKYAATWPGAGFEMRKQYVIFEPRRTV
jgi:hypothetical protein